MDVGLILLILKHDYTQEFHQCYSYFVSRWQSTIKFHGFCVGDGYVTFYQHLELYIRLSHGDNGEQWGMWLHSMTWLGCFHALTLICLICPCAALTNRMVWPFLVLSMSVPSIQAAVMLNLKMTWFEVMMRLVSSKSENRWAKNQCFKSDAIY